ncbi:hypothetical protein FVEG_00533 [Fusarium verticillioides 7600]|uniref:Uncharacterized protein n=1 Tax=Gibberella moniliformis (strain M3125 / FGSC 7600) TaxID=334819 RepID=W7LD78_GIBM7|nr:hypothetical protein FVEG_00533 [Fusarium verticillioides 7600]XP_018742740.1 hypothetical protein FVEG_00533 [Fusarium verticillioides 7600]XP_018742741.1 hypothetical protein FVEG_00533 [Fusarium verticillioides 7600]XP_018742742.1 hypothetical protein FVEG_00533 [Fusarium verticillioides 7600]XP_018742743.1 hypothetical protein FVEG_00533 [Fusarium verticillioides 7600]XP_018742744.1 hypothetical protein FVEG_00533 [Fusarium verticillioides 7600]EWG36548.1 hypothetical protein FVEG_0053
MHMIACRYRIDLLEKLLGTNVDLRISLARRFPLGTIMTSQLFMVQFRESDYFGRLSLRCQTVIDLHPDNHTWSNNRR